MSCPGALLRNKDFCSNSVFFSWSEPGKSELTTPNATPACLLMLIVKPWQKHSAAGLQKSCRIRCLPTTWALLRDVTELTTPDSSDSFPRLAPHAPATQQPKPAAQGTQQLLPPLAPGHRAGVLHGHRLLHPKFAPCSSLPSSPHPSGPAGGTQVCVMNRHPQCWSLKVADGISESLHMSGFPYIWLNVGFFHSPIYSV